MLNSSISEFSEGPSLPPGWLSTILSPPSTQHALLSMIGCPVPPHRPDLEGYTKAITNDYINQQLDLISKFLIESESSPHDIQPDNLRAIASYTLEASFYKLLNGWGNTTNRSIEDMKWIAPYLRLLTDSLRSLPDRMRYEGFGVRVLDASTSPFLHDAWTNYKDHFKVGRPVNFHSVASFGCDERLLETFLNKSTKPIIVLQCQRVVGYKIDEISMIPRLTGGNREGEVLMEAPSFFQVILDPIKIKNHVIVQIKFDEELSKGMAYLPVQSRVGIMKGIEAGTVGQTARGGGGVEEQKGVGLVGSIELMRGTEVSIPQIDLNRDIPGKDQYTEAIELLAKNAHLKAKELFENSASKYPPSYERLNYYYSSGYYTTISEEKSQYYFDLALKNEGWFDKNKSSTDSVIRLSVALFLRNIKKDYNKAIQYLKLCDLNDSTVLYNIGRCYRTKKGVGRDLNEAVRFFNLAAERGHSGALFQLGECYERGMGVSRDVEEAVRYYKLAAAQDNLKAQNVLSKQNCIVS